MSDETIIELDPIITPDPLTKEEICIQCAYLFGGADCRTCDGNQFKLSSYDTLVKRIRTLNTHVFELAPETTI